MLLEKAEEGNAVLGLACFRQTGERDFKTQGKGFCGVAQ